MSGEELFKKLDEIGLCNETPDSEIEKRFAWLIGSIGNRAYSTNNDVGSKESRSIAWTLETANFIPSGDGGSKEKHIQLLADASWGMFSPTEIKWGYELWQNHYSLSFKHNGRSYWAMIPIESYKSGDQYSFYRFPPQILTLINQAICDAGYSSRYFILPWFGEEEKLFVLAPESAYRKAVQEGLIPKMPSPLSELLEIFVKINIDLPEIDEDDLTDGGGWFESVWAKPRSESIWAKPLGDDLYAIRSVPFYAYNLHYDDVVKAVVDSPDAVPKILEVVKPSGHKTVRIKFAEGVSETEKNRVLDEISQRGNSVLRSRDEHIYGIDFYPKDDDYQWIRDETEREEIIESDRLVKFQELLDEIQLQIWGEILEYEIGEQDTQN